MRTGLTKRSFLAAVPAILALPAAIRPGAALAQTVDEVSRRGSIDIGVLIDLPPYGILNAQQQPDGYDVDVAKLLGKYMGVTPNLVQLTAANRVPFLLTGKIDLIVATFGITPERAKQVLFSIPYSALNNVVFAPKTLTIRGMEDLRGKRVGVGRGSVQDMLITGALGSTARIMRFDDSTSSFQALLSGQVDAIGEGELSGRKIFAEAPHIERKFVLLRQPNGITMRKDQFNLHQWVNTFIYYIKNNGELDAIHRRWFDEPLPELPVF